MCFMIDLDKIMLIKYNNYLICIVNFPQKNNHINVETIETSKFSFSNNNNNNFFIFIFRKQNKISIHFNNIYSLFIDTCNNYICIKKSGIDQFYHWRINKIFKTYLNNLNKGYKC